MIFFFAVTVAATFCVLNAVDLVVQVVNYDNNYKY